MTPRSPRLWVASLVALAGVGAAACTGSSSSTPTTTTGTDALITVPPVASRTPSTTAPRPTVASTSTPDPTAPAPPTTTTLAFPPAPPWSGQDEWALGEPVAIELVRHPAPEVAGDGDAWGPLPIPHDGFIASIGDGATLATVRTSEWFVWDLASDEVIPLPVDVALLSGNAPIAFAEVCAAIDPCGPAAPAVLNLATEEIAIIGEPAEVIVTALSDDGTHVFLRRAGPIDGTDLVWSDGSVTRIVDDDVVLGDGGTDRTNRLIGVNADGSAAARLPPRGDAFERPHQLELSRVGGEPVVLLTNDESFGGDAWFSADGSTILASSWLGGILFDTETGERLATGIFCDPAIPLTPWRGAINIAPDTWLLVFHDQQTRSQVVVVDLVAASCDLVADIPEGDGVAPVQLIGSPGSDTFVMTGTWLMPALLDLSERAPGTVLVHGDGGWTVRSP